MSQSMADIVNAGHEVLNISQFTTAMCIHMSVECALSGLQDRERERDDQRGAVEHKHRHIHIISL